MLPNSPGSLCSLRRCRRIFLICLACITAAVAIAPFTVAAQTEGDYLYNVTLLRAAPGHFTDLITTLEESFELNREAGDHAPFWIRHSQGDHWDFMLLYPMGDWAQYYTASRIARRESVWSAEKGQALTKRLEEFTSYREDWFARSIDSEEMTTRFEGTGMFHVEMFAGLPGKREELIEQRRMENRYYEHLNRQQNVLFIRDAGMNWDVMTIGFHESLSAFAAAGSRYSEQEQDEAAKVAGFSGVNEISPYLRSLLSYHNDTLGVRAQ